MKLRNMNSKVTATLSEVAVHQQIHFQLEKQKEDLAHEVKQAQSKLESGEPPTSEAEKQWQQYTMQSQQRTSSYEFDNMNSYLYRAEIQAQPEEQITQDGYFTTAERRSNMYIPESGLQLPKPYGAFAPMKPAELGSNLRHYKNPKQSQF